jgi:hypothetical protein
MNSPAAEPQGPIRTPLPNPLPVRRGEGEATPRSLSALIQRQWGQGEGSVGSSQFMVPMQAEISVEAFHEHQWEMNGPLSLSPQPLK